VFVALITQHAKRMRFIVLSMVCLVVPYFSSLSHTENKMSVLIFCTAVSLFNCLQLFTYIRLVAENLYLYLTVLHLLESCYVLLHKLFFMSKLISLNLSVIHNLLEIFCNSRLSKDFYFTFFFSCVSFSIIKNYGKF
jgi:hypothetical protein